MSKCVSTMSVNPGIPLPTFNDRTGAESRGEPSYINGASRTTATLNGVGEFLQLRNRSCIFVASMLGSLVIFWAPLQRLVQFAENSEFSYIPLIPAISAFLIVMRRRPI